MKFLQAFVAYAAADITASASWDDLVAAVADDDENPIPTTKTYTSDDIDGWTNSLTYALGLLDQETADA